MDAKTLKRNLLFNTAGNLIYFACQWLVTGFFVKLLSEGQAGIDNAGLLATAMAATNVFLTIANYGMRTYQVSDVAGKYSNADYISSRAATCLAAVSLCGVYVAAVGYSKEQTLCVFTWLIYKLTEAVTDVFHGICQKKDRMDIIGISYAARGLVGTLVFCLVLIKSGNLVYALLSMTTVCWAFCAAYDLRKSSAFYRPLERTSVRSVGLLLLECLPLALYGAFNTATSSIPKLFLERMEGKAVIGIYGLVNSPVLILQVGVAFMFAPFITSFARLFEAKDSKGFIKLSIKVIALVLTLGGVGVVVAATLGEFGLTLLYGEEIAEYKYLLIPMVFSVIVTVLSLFLCMLLTVLRDFKGLIFSTALGIAVSAAISLPLIRSFSMNGATLSAIIALSAQSLLLALFGLRTLKRSGAKQ